jgi:CBS domain-containing protein
MKKNTPISQLIRTNCTVIEAGADIQNIRFIFDHFPNQFLPVVKGLRFIGVILRDEFFRNYIPGTEGKFKAADLISKEIVMLSPENSLDDAKEVFDSKIYDIIPVADEDGDLMGIVLREDVEIQLSRTSIFSNPVLSLTRAFA